MSHFSRANSSISRRFALGWRLPILRKDFILDPYQLLEARLAGADAVLLIAEILGKDELTLLVDQVQALGMQALVELYDPENLARIVASGARLIGVNNRDLRTFVTRLEQTLELLPRMPADACVVSESGIRTRADVQRLQTAGVRAVLIGETFMRAPILVPSFGNYSAPDRHSRAEPTAKRFRKEPGMPARLPETVAAFCGRHSLMAGGGVVAVSGGADSVCLAKLLCDLQRQGQFSKLVLAHLNHQLRGTDSDADEAFVLALGRQWALPVRTTRVDVASAAKSQGENLEETARRLRYEWLALVARAERCAWVATGHTADDQAETVLHRLLRGSGLQGLAAMAAQRPLEEGISLVRPLLGTQRSQVVIYLAHEKQDFREDSSNQDLRFTRNRLRHELLPLLVEQFNPGIVDVLCRLADQAVQCSKRSPQQLRSFSKARSCLVLPIRSC